MEDLIQQAFLHVDGIGEHVAAGHYDLVGPDNEIILPRIWDVVVKPDWNITMHMWPMAEEKPPEPELPPPPPEPTAPVKPPKPHRKPGGGGGGGGLFGFGGGGGERRGSKGKHARPKSMHVGPGIEVIPDAATPSGAADVVMVPDPPKVGGSNKKVNRRSMGPSPLMMWTAGGMVRKGKGN